MKIKIRFLLIFISLLLLLSCQNKEKREAKKIITEWVGKKIQIPENIPFSVLGKDTTCQDLLKMPYKILLYVDSIGCLSCRLKLSDWKILMKEVDSIAPGKVGFIYLFQPKKEKELQLLLQQYQMHYPVIVDPTDEINKQNSFPKKQQYQCFLLDQSNKVLMIGNPVHNPQIWNLFKAQITGKPNKEKHLLTSIQTSSTDVDFGRIQVNKKSTIRIKLTNTGNNPLIIYSAKTSCGCTNVDFEKEPVKSGKNTNIAVSITPDNKGYFHKTVEIYANTYNPPTQLLIKGIAE